METKWRQSGPSKTGEHRILSTINLDSDDEACEPPPPPVEKVVGKVVENLESPKPVIQDKEKASNEELQPEKDAEKSGNKQDDDDDCVIILDDDDEGPSKTLSKTEESAPEVAEAENSKNPIENEEKIDNSMEVSEKVEEEGKEKPTEPKEKTDSDIEEVEDEDIMKDIEPVLPTKEIGGLMMEVDDEPHIVVKAVEENQVVEASSRMQIDEKFPAAEQKALELENAFKLAHVDCVNLECKKLTESTCEAPNFVLSYFRIPLKKGKAQKVCFTCYHDVVENLSKFCGALEAIQPLLFEDLPKHSELVEISDSSDEEDDKELLPKEASLPEAVIETVEAELQNIIDEAFDKINIEQQMVWAKSIMTQRVERNNEICKEITENLSTLQRDVDRIHLNLYAQTRPQYEELPSCNIFHEVDLSSGFKQQQTGGQAAQKQNSSAQHSTPSMLLKKEEFVRPAVVVGQFYFAVRQKLLGNWAECQVAEAVPVAEKKYYRVNFIGGTSGTATRVVPAKELAYRHSFNVKLPLGTRIIARFDANKTQANNLKASFYPGIIAEPFGSYNRHRYLIFFDDGYAQYVHHTDLRVVCEESAEVWEDIHIHSREFIKNYLINFRSQRPMVQVKIGQRIITECKGKWIYAKVTNIDASLVQLYFAEDSRYEWIYRGSTRLGPLYNEKAMSVNNKQNKYSKFQKRNEPSIEYITIDDDDEAKTSKTSDMAKSFSAHMQAQQQPQEVNIRAVAKKSTVTRPQPQQSAVFMNSSTIYCEDDRPKGKVVYYTAKRHLPPQKFKMHKCSPGCLFAITHNLRSYSPLAKPLLSGWERQLCKTKTKKVYIMYRAPCGRRLRNMGELHYYLRTTKASLNVDNFDFDYTIHCLAEYVIENHIYHNPDLSDGRENLAIPSVNYFDDTQPPPCIYSTERLPTEGVNLNLDTNFLCGCDCEDDCIDKSKCQCWQLTMAGAKFGNPNTSIDNTGYVYKRLQEPVLTGIYECNSRCKCKQDCLNRVVQHPLQTKLQVFKTNNRGWGIRCLNDVPKGSFICIYSGHLLTEEAGNEICQKNENNTGDEYFADLDYIETVEQLKEGYETDAIETESEPDSDGPDYDVRRDSDVSDEDFKASIRNTSGAAIRTRAQSRRDKKDSKSDERKKDRSDHKRKDELNGGKPKGKGDSITISDDEEGKLVREPVNLEPTLEMDKEDVPNISSKFRSVRKLFGKHEHIYIMDAKKSGNIGRYFNHSCAPNLFVQNVFVDTHDLRFPWVAFFALSHIRAGTELTWNYNYDVGSVPGKVLYCQCGAESCRQRLL